MTGRLLVFAVGFALAATVALAGGNGETGADGSRVVASIKPVHSLVSAVMAGVGEPHLIIRGASSPHTFSMRPSDAAALADARVIFLIDEHKEVSLAGPIANLGVDALVVQLAGAEGIVLKPLREGGAFEAHTHDEHDEDDHDEESAHDEEDGPRRGWPPPTRRVSTTRKTTTTKKTTMTRTTATMKTTTMITSTIMGISTNMAPSIFTSGSIRKMPC